MERYSLQNVIFDDHRRSFEFFSEKCSNRSYDLFSNHYKSMYSAHYGNVCEEKQLEYKTKILSDFFES